MPAPARPTRAVALVGLLAAALLAGSGQAKAGTIEFTALINQRQRRRSGPGCRLARSDAIGGRPLI